MFGKASLLITALMIVAMFCLAAEAQQSPPTDERSEETKTGSISGSVVNENGQPLANAAVYLRAYGSGGQGRATTTDSDGSFQVNFEKAGATLTGRFISPRQASGDLKGGLSAQCGAKLVKVGGTWSAERK